MLKRLFSSSSEL
jgi:hypothetical protein